MHCASFAIELASSDLIQHQLEVVQEYGIGGTFEYQGKPPVWVDARSCGAPRSANNDVCDDESNGQEHASQHNAEARVHANKVVQLKAVCFADGVEKFPGCEEPPWISDECLPGTHSHVRLCPVSIPVHKTGPDLSYPEWLHGEKGIYKDFASVFGQKRADL
jgi:hypothetical protein